MSLHYKKDGSLDMRYSSSRAAVASSSYSSFSSSSSYGGGGSYSSYTAPSSSSRTSSSEMHYKKDGSLDMRYSSSRAAATTIPTSSRPVSAVSSTSTSSNLHYKKDGSLDMRYSSSRAAATTIPTSSRPVSAASSTSTSSNLHYKKDGTLDMRYKSSQTVAATPTTRDNLHHKKDGSLDMRYKSSQEIAQKMKQLNVSSSPGQVKDSTTKQRQSMGIPAYVPVTKAGLPDLRTNAAKDWVQVQAQAWNDVAPLPAWIPRLKDGSPDTSKSITRKFFSNTSPPPESRRDDYYAERLSDETYQGLIEAERAQEVPRIREPEPLRETAAMQMAFDQMYDPKPDSDDIVVLPSSVQQLDYALDLVIDKEEVPLGHGSFGIVLQGMWNDKVVAIKKLHTSQLSKKDRKMFIKETLVLGMLGEHPNIVQLYGYTLSPLAIVMEYVPRGSLSYMLHYCDDPNVEAKMTDGRVKLNLLLGIVHGMIQLHKCGITHGDLKPQNVLISDDYQAKIADFGLATLRAKTSSTTSSHMLGSSSSNTADDDDTDPEGMACGTAAYMAPELLNTHEIANEKTDVYSFGILMNEMLQEEEPYYQNLRQFVGKGPYAAVLAARNGQRPVVHDTKVTLQLKRLIERCWSPCATDRPTFKQIGAELATCSGIPNSCD